MYIVGAGCGDFDLITMRGAEYIRHCDVLVYDSLIDVSLLGFAPETAEKICVGKRFGRHSEKQENINEILVEKAREGKLKPSKVPIFRLILYPEFLPRLPFPSLREFLLHTEI